MSKLEYLIIDAYNIIHAWSDLKKLLVQGNIDAASSQLIDRVRVIHDVDKIRVTVVFDGQGNKPEIIRPAPELTFSLLYSPTGVSADSLIEQITLNSKHPERITVASEDSFIRQTILSVGAKSIASDQLTSRILSCKIRQKNDLEKHKKSINKVWDKDNPWNVL